MTPLTAASERSCEEKDLPAALAQARATFKGGSSGLSVLDLLCRGTGLDCAQLADWLNRRAGVDVSAPERRLRPDFSKLEISTAREWRCVILQGSAGEFFVGAEDPWDESLLQRVSRRSGLTAQPMAVSSKEIDDWLATGAGSGPEAPPVGVPADGPIVRFVDRAITTAIDSGASDIHFECDRQGVTVKHRNDGVMAFFARLDGAERAQEVISRIKVMAQLDITERRLPQDGRFRFGLAAAQLDLRVSIMPSVHGEDAVLRVLDKAQLRSREQVATLDLLGFEPTAAQTIRDLANAPNGMLLVTGPTGSGKTTTVYAALSEINTGLEKIITIEDPVEYELAGVLQIPVNERKGLTFAKGLRSILRHDPDRILVGEIRDAETAEIAVQSALTGHLVFTTVHANSVTDIIGRFRHFGLDMFGFMSSLNGVVVQRLVRRLCPDCLSWREPNVTEATWLVRAGQAQVTRVPHAVGCTVCHGTGYKGRFVVAEIHSADDELRDLVTTGAPLSALKAHGLARGVEPLASQAARLVVRGMTTTQEVKRVVGWT